MKLTTLTTLFLTTILLPGWLTYTNAANKFTMNYPKEWVEKETVNSILFLSPKDGDSDVFQENVNLMLQDLSQQPMDLEQYTAVSKQQITENAGPSAILSSGPKILAGQKAVETIYTMNYQGHSLKIKQYWFIKDKTAYLFTYTAEVPQFARYEETATAVINSFKFF